MSKFNISKLKKVLNKTKTGDKRLKNKRRIIKKVNTLKNKKYSRKNDINSIIKASIFRFLNEKLYTCTSTEAFDYFKLDPEAFNVYHDGFKQQLSVWPNDPLEWVKNSILKYLKNENKVPIVADLGCGDARLSTMLPKSFNTYSFDIVAVNDRVTVCDMAKTSLKDGEVDFAVFCLSLMGTNCKDFLYEANRILRMEGYLIIVDVASRFEGKFNQFLKKLKSYGFEKVFSEVTKDTYFVRACMHKTVDCRDIPKSKLHSIKLNPCTYKKR